MDDNARQHFEELMEELKKQLLDSMFKQLNEGMSQMSPEQLARMKDMMAELNHMLEQREAGEEPDFEGFMERFGDFFPDNPQTLDELLENMAQLDGADAAAAQLDVARAARPAAGDGRTRSSTTWTCAGRSTSSVRTCATRSRRPAGARACVSAATSRSRSTA